MPFPEDIRRGIDSLKRMCDPRGHDLLDAIGDALVGRAEQEERLEAQLDMLYGREIVDGTSALPRISEPVAAPSNVWDCERGGHLFEVGETRCAVCGAMSEVADNSHWSRRAELRSVR